MLKSLMIISSLLFCNATRSQTTLQTVTTSGNFTTNAIRIGGEGNIGISGGGEIVIGLLNTPMSNDTRTFIGWKGDATSNTIINGPAGTLLLQGRSDLTYAPIDFVTGSTTPQLTMWIAGNGNVAIGNYSLTPSSKLLITGSGNTSSTTSLLVQNSSNTDALRVIDNGYVGIGTSTPQAKLDFNGNIYTNGKIFIGTPDTNTATQISPYALAVNGAAVFTKAKVALYGSWPDYAFDSSYHQMPLPALEKYIKQNKHLPEVPSGKEVQKDGIDLGAPTRRHC